MEIYVSLGWRGDSEYKKIDPNKWGYGIDKLLEVMFLLDGFCSFILKIPMEPIRLLYLIKLTLTLSVSELWRQDAHSKSLILCMKSCCVAIQIKSP